MKNAKKQTPEQTALIALQAELAKLREENTALQANLQTAKTTLTPEQLALARKEAAEKAWVTIRAKKAAKEAAEKAAKEAAEKAAKEAADRIAELESRLNALNVPKRKRA